ncbi:MAG: RimK family alpha-L-glutamate ligase [Marinicellaceae bacterium]
MNVVILSRNEKLYSTRRLVDESVKFGHSTTVVDYMHCHIVNQASQNSILHYGKPLKLVDAIIPRIGATYTDYGATLLRQFELQNLKTLVSSEALLMARNKLHCLQKLMKVKVKIPATYFAHYFNNLNDIISTVGGFPFIIKQLEGTQGHGVFLIKDQKQASEIIKIHESVNRKFIFQKFIKESKGCDIRAFVVGGVVVAAMKRQAKPEEFRSNLHQGGKGLNIKLTDLETNTAVKSAAAMGLSVAGVDMLQSNHGPLVIEVNASPGLEGIEKTTQVNVAEKIIKYLEKII